MWSYYGSKSKIVKKYPKPTRDTIIEYFAGSARYALEYFEKDVILIDKYEVIVRLWQYLQRCSPKDILGLPKLTGGDNLDNFTQLSKEEKWLMGFMVQQGVNSPRKTVSKVFGNGRMDILIERDKARIAGNLHKIKHWKIIHGEYNCVANTNATHFIDPPYQFGGEFYVGKVSNKHIDFKTLREFAESRIGQTIVCENSKADWMPFTYLSDLSGSKNKTKEVIWYNEQ